MAQNTQYLSRLMSLSWQIQKRRRINRGKALQSAWAIISNDQITIHYLVRKLNHHKPVSNQTMWQYQLFNK
jgi:hypothetical protein